MFHKTDWKILLPVSFFKKVARKLYLYQSISNPVVFSFNKTIAIKNNGWLQQKSKDGFNLCNIIIFQEVNTVSLEENVENLSK